jgi:very-short-patch-repair endonuclease
MHAMSPVAQSCNTTKENPLPQAGGGLGWGLSVTAESKTRRTQPKSLASARRLRRSLTDAERRLWHYLRQKQINGFHFRKQCPVGPYIADFACLSAKLIVEVDGGQHADSATDVARDAWFTAHGYRTLRFWNNDVLQNTDGVIMMITEALGQVESPPNAQAH